SNLGHHESPSKKEHGLGQEHYANHKAQHNAMGVAEAAHVHAPVQTRPHHGHEHAEHGKGQEHLGQQKIAKAGAYAGETAATHVEQVETAEEQQRHDHRHEASRPRHHRRFQPFHHG